MCITNILYLRILILLSTLRSPALNKKKWNNVKCKDPNKGVASIKLSFNARSSACSIGDQILKWLYMWEMLLGVIIQKRVYSGKEIYIVKERRRINIKNTTIL